MRMCEIWTIPESVDGAMARNTRLFLTDKPSDQNKSELAKKGIKWIVMADCCILEQFSKRLDEMDIDNVVYGGKLPKTIKNQV